MEYYGVYLRPALSQIPSTSLPGHTVNWNRITTVIKPHLYRQGGGFVFLNPHLKYHAPYIYGLPLSQIDEYFTQVVKSNYSNVPTQLVPKHIMQFVHSQSFLPPQTSHPPHLALSLSGARCFCTCTLLADSVSASSTCSIYSHTRKYRAVTWLDNGSVCGTFWM